jgi:hypothetical protein
MSYDTNTYHAVRDTISKGINALKSFVGGALYQTLGEGNDGRRRSASELPWINDEPTDDYTDWPTSAEQPHITGSRTTNDTIDDIL